MEPKLICSNPNNSPPRMAARFLRSLLRIYRGSSSASAERSRRIKRAAYASVAYSAGARMAWSRALLSKLRRRRPRPVRPSVVPALPRRIRTAVAAPRRRRQEAGRGEAVLRNLVPGGAGMEYCRLLEEAADYARCLAAQVQLMKTVVDSFHG